jgi:hypothetical protein
MAADTHALLHLADASLCGDVAAILRARAGSLERDEPSPATPPQRAAVLYAQT